MPLNTSDIKFVLSGGALNTNPLDSLGGIKSSTVMGSDLFDRVSGEDAFNGDTEYRCVYIHNAHPTLPMLSTKLWLEVTTASSDVLVALGVGSSLVGGEEQSLGTESTAPIGITFSSPSSYSTGLSLGDIPAGQHKAVHIRRTIATRSTISTGLFVLKAQCDTTN